MHDDRTTVRELKEAVHEMCLKKGWGGETGVQNPQHVAMAMTVEMSELLEHFQWLDAPEVDNLLAGRDPQRVEQIAEEFADVMMYGMQLMRCLNIDVSAAIERKIGIVLARQPGYKRGDTVSHT